MAQPSRGEQLAALQGAKGHSEPKPIDHRIRLEPCRDSGINWQGFEGSINGIAIKTAMTIHHWSRCQNAPRDQEPLLNLDALLIQLVCGSGCLGCCLLYTSPSPRDPE